MMGQQGGFQRDLMWRVTLTIVSIFGWLIFVVVWLFFFTSGLGLAQNLAVFLVSLLLLIGAMTLTWVTWAMKRPPVVQQMPGYPPVMRISRWKAALSGIAVIAWLSFLVIWLFFFANDFSLYQNFGAILASLLIVGGTTWAIGLIAR